MRGRDFHAHRFRQQCQKDPLDFGVADALDVQFLRYPGAPVLYFTSGVRTTRNVAEIGEASDVPR